VRAEARKPRSPVSQRSRISPPGFEAWDLGLRGAILYKAFRNSPAAMTHPFNRTKPARLVR
jgi:hypothetical protein